MFEAMNVAILIGAALVAAAAFTSILSFRFGAPAAADLPGGRACRRRGRARHPVRQSRRGIFRWLSGARHHPVRFRFRHAAGDVAHRRPAGADAGDGRRAADGGARWLRRAGVSRLHLASGTAARRHRGADRRGGGVLPAAGRRHHAARSRPLDAGGGVRLQRPDRDLPDGGAGRAGRRAGRAGRHRLVRPAAARHPACRRRGGRIPRWHADRAGGQPHELRAGALPDRGDGAGAGRPMPLRAWPGEAASLPSMSPVSFPATRARAT